MKKIITLVLSVLMVFTLAACGETSNSGDVSDISAEGVKSEATMETPATEEPVHEHTFTTVANNDGTHTTKCSDETCTESTTENCVFNEEYVCETCGYVHEHTLEVTSNEDGTHYVKCNVDYCNYETTENCIFNEEYVCETCGYVHEHTLEATSNEDGTHTLKCTIEGCAYENTEPCTLNEDYVCEVCGYKHEHTLTVTSNNDGTHEEVCSTCDYKKTVKCKDKNGTCETCGYQFHSSKYACGKYTVKDVNDKVVGTYGSLDEICLAYFGEDWGTIKATWNYHNGDFVTIQSLPSYMRSDNKYSIGLRNESLRAKYGEINDFAIFSPDLTSHTTYYVIYRD